MPLLLSNSLALSFLVLPIFFLRIFHGTTRQIPSQTCCFKVVNLSFLCLADEDKWKTETKTEGGAIQEYLISYQNLVPSTTYYFRVIAYNKYGISFPTKSSDAVSIKMVRFSANFVARTMSTDVL